MTVAVLEREPEQVAPAAMPGLRLIVLARIACDDGASRAELWREVGPCVGTGGGRLPIEAELAELIRAGLAIEFRSRFSASEAGAALLAGELALKTLPRTWSELRDGRLVAKALGIERETAARIKALSRPDELRAAILAQAYCLKPRVASSSSKLRAALALAALERAFGNKIKSELSASAAFNAKASRVLAGQLLRKPRDAGTDKRLIALLAAEAVNCAKPDAAALRLALLRRLAAGSDAGTTAVAGADAALVRRVAADVAPSAPTSADAATTATARPAAASRPDLPGFVTVVRQLAAEHAEGWAGNRKALVSRVFK